MSDQEKQQSKVLISCEPPFEVGDFPERLGDITLKETPSGQASIALAGPIGVGKWLLGASILMKSLALLWITTISSLLQVFLSLISLWKNSDLSKRYVWRLTYE